MAIPSLPEDEVRRRIAMLEQCYREGFTPPHLRGGNGAAIQEAARRLGIKAPTLLSTMRIEERKRDKGLAGIVADEGLYAPPLPLPKVPTNGLGHYQPPSEVLAGLLTSAPDLAEELETQRTIRRLSTEVGDLRRSLKEQMQRADRAEDIRDGVFKLREADLGPPEWPEPDFSMAHGRHKPILLTSDFQFGEVVRPEEIGGLNEFNADIFAERYSRMIDKTIRWCDAIAKGWGAEYPEGIVYLRGGDAISGEIHAELAETNDFSAVPAVRELIKHEREGIRRLRDRFGHVHVMSIPGNHGRTTFKPRAKRYVDTNFETIIGWWLASIFDDDPCVTCEVPPSGDAYFNAEGHRFLLSHGDRMGSRGGMGFVGPIATIARGHQRLRMASASGGKPVDVVLTGHLHTSVKTEWGFANGSLIGYSEYANSFRAEPDSAKQWLIMAHRSRVYGIELELSDKPRRKD